MKNKMDGLIEILFDPTAREDEKGDAVIDLESYSNLKASIALLEFGSKQDLPEDILDDCGNSIGRICVSINKKVDDQIFEKLTPITQKTAFAYILSHSPEFIKPSLREELSKKFGLKM